MTQLPKTQWINWYENLSCSAVRFDAATPDDVVQAVNYAKIHDLSLRMAGTGHSNIALVPTSGVVVTTDQLQGLLDHDSDDSTVTLAAGTKIRAMGDMLWEHGLSLPNQGDIDTQSIVGAISTGTHGTGITLKNMSASVLSMTLVTATGELRTITEADGDLMRAARVSMGMLGAVTSIDMSVCPAYKLHEWIGFMPYRQAAEIEDEMNEKYRHFTYFWCADAKSAHWLGFDQGAMSEGDREYACVRIFDPQPIDLPAELERCTYRRRHDRAYRIYAEDYAPEFDEMEYMVPLASGRACFEELTDTMRDDFKALQIPTEVRVTAGDDSLLSEFEGGPRRSISLGGRMHEDNDEFFRRCDAVFARYGGRSHWAKANCMTRDRLRALFPRFDDFVAIRREIDPSGLFLNNYLKRWFE